ncbi:hypothetical protein ACQKP0_11225 [Heyndrickxia sp. NPDC080065]|uniref:hypothetical protein n=1 Tax=Heyndrickxia sp. NPDC080065 TaxID=3390568 RepID=UPI003CFBD6DE
MLFTPMVINLLGFKVNAVDNSSAVNVGSFQVIDHFNSYKRNQGIGEQNGDLAPIYIPFGTVIDPDITDDTTAKNSLI